MKTMHKVAIFVLLLHCMVFGQTQEERMLSDQFTADLRRLTESFDISGIVHFDKTGSIDFWVMKGGEFYLLDFATSIGWVAGFYINSPEWARYMDTLYFKREVDRFSMGEITVKECVLIFALINRGSLTDRELESVIMETIKWTRIKDKGGT